VVWKAEPHDSASPSVRFTYLSPDGEDNFPGNLSVAVTMTLTQDSALKIEYTASTDQPTPVNLTNHSYWNLGGAGNGTILDEDLTLNADKYTPVNDLLIPTGELRDVTGTPFDFRKATAVGARIDQVPGGYDHNFVLNVSGNVSPTFAARVHDPKTGRVMVMHTTEPGVQFYVGNFLDGKLKGTGGTYMQHGALCLEAQVFPDALHHANFPSIILNPGQTYHQITEYKFSVE